jgi:hypothetical protein
MTLYLLGVLLHGGHAGSNREWMLPVLLFAGFSTAWIGRWLARRHRDGPSDHDEPI